MRLPSLQVDSTYRGLRLGLRVIEALMAAAQASTHRLTGWVERSCVAVNCVLQ